MRLEIQNQFNTVKQGDTKSEFKFKLLDFNNQPIDLNGKTVAIVIANRDGFIKDKTPVLDAVETGVVSFKFTSADLIGHGEMRLEVHVTDNSGEVQIIPSSGYYRFIVEQSLDNISEGTVTSYSLEYFNNQVEVKKQELQDDYDVFTASINESESIRQANETARESNESTRQANETNRQSSFSTAITNAETATTNADAATTAANEATTNANNATTNANQAATSTIINWLSPVATFADISTTYPNPQNGDTVQVESDPVNNGTYRFNGTEWKKIQNPNGYANTSEVGDLSTLTTTNKTNIVTAINENAAQLADKTQEITDLQTNKMDKNTTGIAVSQIDKNKGKLDQTFMTDEFLQQMAGNTPINAIPANESLGTAKYINGSITKGKVDFVKRGKNIFNRRTVTSGKLISYTTGNLVDNADYLTNDFEEIDENTDFTQNISCVLAFYDINKVFISGLAQVTPYSIRTFKTPINARYYRTSVGNSNLEVYQIEKGLSSTAYEPYQVKVNDILIGETNLDKTVIDKLDNGEKAALDVTSLSTDFLRVANIQDKFENQTTSGNTGTEQNNTSTFSGWGSPVGVNQTFDTISFYVRAWDATKPITKVRVIVKENNSTGTVLADKTVDVSVPQNVLHKLTVKLDTVVSNDGAVPLWVEYHTNGRTGYLGTNPVQYPNTSYPRLRYSTKSSTTDLTMVESAANFNIYIEFKKYAGNEVRATQEFSESLSVAGGQQQKVDNYGKFNLKNWQAIASQYDDSSYVGRLELSIIGDSWVQGGHLRTGDRLALPLRNKLKSIYGDAGIGFIGFANAHYGNGSLSLTLTGTWTQYDVPTGNANSKGIDGAHAQSSTAGDSITLSISENNNYLEIHNIKQTGSYRYQVDGGTWTTVDTSLTDITVISGLTSASHTFVIEVLSGTVALIGAYSYASNKGVVVHKVGNGGAKASDFTSVDQTNWINQVAKTNFHSVGLLLGTNDMSANVPVDTFKSQIKTIISNIRQAKPNTDVFLIAPSGNNLTGKLHTMTEYNQAMLDVAKEVNTGFVSLNDNLGTYEEAYARGLMQDDGVHPSANGGRVISNVVYDRLLRVG